MKPQSIMDKHPEERKRIIAGDIKARQEARDASQKAAAELNPQPSMLDSVKSAGASLRDRISKVAKSYFQDDEDTEGEA